MKSDGLFGISAAVATPFDEEGHIDFGRLAAHSRRLLEEGCSSLTYFGTTGEGPSLSFAERRQTLNEMVAAGIPAEKINVGIIVASLGDAIEEGRFASDLGCNAILLAPPFYFKTPDDEGLFAWFSGFVSALGKDSPKIILYHIPQVTAAPLSMALIRKLKDAFPEKIYGVKDSSGVWENGEALLKMHDIAIMLGDERLLGQASRLGGQGMISGVANFDAPSLVRTLETGIADPALNTLVDLIVSHPVIPAVKVALAHYLGDEAWTKVRAPLVELDSGAANAIVSGFDAHVMKKAS